MLRSLRKLRCWVYDWGFRPKYGSILFSPSLDWQYGFLDSNIAEAMADALKKAREDYDAKSQTTHD